MSQPRPTPQHMGSATMTKHMRCYDFVETNFLGIESDQLGHVLATQNVPALTEKNVAFAWISDHQRTAFVQILAEPDLGPPRPTPRPANPFTAPAQTLRKRGRRQPAVVGLGASLLVT